MEKSHLWSLIQTLTVWKQGCSVSAAILSDKGCRSHMTKGFRGERPGAGRAASPAGRGAEPSGGCRSAGVWWCVEGRTRAGWPWWGRVYCSPPHRPRRSTPPDTRAEPRSSHCSALTAPPSTPAQHTACQHTHCRQTTNHHHVPALTVSHSSEQYMQMFSVPDIGCFHVWSTKLNKQRCLHLSGISGGSKGSKNDKDKKKYGMIQTFHGLNVEEFNTHESNAHL